jgi:tRNA dimethylallyltransferase
LGEIVSRNALPVVVGGTGFYLRALTDGLFAAPERDEALRDRLMERERRRPGSLHRLLGRFDPGSLPRVHVRDVHKTIRALEVCLAARRPMSRMFTEGRPSLEGFRVLKIGLDPPREALYARLDARCLQMFQHGLVEETQAILSRGFPASAKPFESHGYRQALELLRGAISLDEAIESAQRNTRRYAKRQWTWFRKELGVEWYGGFGAEDSTQSLALERVRDFLKKNSLS